MECKTPITKRIAPEKPRSNELRERAKRISHLTNTIWCLLDMHDDLRTDMEKACAWDSVVALRARVREALEVQ
jgi:hypothetical protein